MRFVVTRTSGSWDPPCDGATRGLVPSWDVRTSGSPEEFDADMGRRFTGRYPAWLSEGSEHCVTPDGKIARRRAFTEAWLVDVPDLEALVDFVDRYGAVVVQRKFRCVPVIEIYDDYRE